MPELQNARRQELMERVSALLRAWNLREPAIVLLTMHAPLAFFGSQLLLAAQPFLGMFSADALARDLILFLDEPQNVQDLITYLEASPPSS